MSNDPACPECVYVLTAVDFDLDRVLVEVRVRVLRRGADRGTGRGTPTDGLERLFDSRYRRSYGHRPPQTRPGRDHHRTSRWHGWLSCDGQTRPDLPVRRNRRHQLLALRSDPSSGLSFGG
jgi:hypothetical protein